MTIIEQLKTAQPMYWHNEHKIPWSEAKTQLTIDDMIIDVAEARLQRFAPYFLHIEEATRAYDGLIESPLVEALTLSQEVLVEEGRLLLKRDDILPISNSIKARGGIHEVLKIAEQLALEHQLITIDENYEKFQSTAFQTFFSTYKIVVGSTGNLGLSIGIMGALLGFHVIVHMSHDAKQWKKDLLREKGVEVIEHAGDYGEAVIQGRAEAAADAQAFFIDDENSLELFSGYAVAARRLAQQLRDLNVDVSNEQPLAVYLPCGVGGGPGGVAFGLKTVFGDAVHCYFVEPVQSPCMLLGMATGEFQNIAVQDIGLTNQTAADGLAVGRASSFVGQLMTPLLQGIYTVTDEQLYRMVYRLSEQEDIKIEPSAAAGLLGPKMTQARAATHLVWLTGGGMVPIEQWTSDFERGEQAHV